MIISVYSPQASNNGTTVASMLLALGLANLKRKVLLTHTNSKSVSFEHYFGIKAYEDKTTTPTQLVKLMRDGAVKPEEISDYCKNVYETLDVFTNNTTTFTQDDMNDLTKFVLETKESHDHYIFDIDSDCENADFVLKNSDVIIINLAPNKKELDKFNDIRQEVMKKCAGKKIILLTNKYDKRAMKTKEIGKHIGANIVPNVIHYNSWITQVCNHGKLVDLVIQGKRNVPTVIDIYRDINGLAQLLNKARIEINKDKKAKEKGVFQLDK